ncbi:glycosyltransferase family 59 protein [Hypoxylon sp. FL1857]|nr:glycosyltransferase family 59 protein [Hypoxylon sp. FL1857]
MAPWPKLDSSFGLQVARYFLISMILRLYTIHKTGLTSSGSFIILSLGAVSLLAQKWVSSVTNHVPEPYLDEVFHIPQAQVYCDGRYSVWDDKITTPPGLYVLSILANLLSGWPCSVYYLRLFNVEVIPYLALAAIMSRALLEQPRTAGNAQGRSKFSVYAVWTGINISLFPVLFFFTGLYYTDVISTFVVLLTYVNHLGRVSKDRTSLANDAYTLFLGLLALCMRQTNIFWVVVYMGGLEAVHSIKTLRPEPVAVPAFTALAQQIQFYTWRYSLGDIHDPSLNLTSPIDLVLCTVSIGIAATCNIWTIIRQRIWPHLVVLGAFVGFVAWNGGVVLGDKSNHVATLHLAQMLYIWPLFAFFSAPLFIPQLLDLLTLTLKPFTSSTKAPLPRNNPRGANDPEQSAVLRVFNQLGSSHTAHSIIVLVGALVAAALIVKFNTIIHPFTLADNRHYMFYVFRYSILKAWWVRYALVPVYVACGWLCWTALQGSPSITTHEAHQRIQTPSSIKSQASLPPQASRAPQKSQPSQTTNEQPASSPSRPPQILGDRATISPSTSSVLILLFSATLSLITAPLVEPRYFIIPWVFWRLLVPTRPAVPGSGSPTSRWLVPFLETAWFLVINAATMYIFITRPFYWWGPNGELVDQGRVQRFMW